MIDYSVIIRTTGKAGEKYQRLLNSISQLEPQPKEIIVILPENYEKPYEKLGWETYYFCEKGMVTQRLVGVEMCRTKYALICDDDVCFDSDFVLKLHKPIELGIAKFSAGPLLSFLPREGMESVFYAITGAAIPMKGSRESYIKVLSTTGYSYNRRIKTDETNYLNAESLPWTCFYGEIESFKRIRMDEEKWLQLHGYASMDDQTMFYKAYLMGIRTVVVTDASYEHLDARTSRKILSEISYSMEFNRYVFWHRFIYNVDTGIGRVKDTICIKYYFFMKWFYNIMRLFTGRLDKAAFEAKRMAVKDAKRYVKSPEYIQLPSIKKMS